MANSATAALPAIRIGSKTIYLPNFTLTLLRTPFLPPTYAQFIVPLSFNKLDLKDYLYHAYGLRALSIRSYVQQQRVQEDQPGAKRPSPRRWYRPRSIKKMTIQMAQPFIWPEEPTDLSAWDKQMYDARRDAQEAQQEQQQFTTPSSERAPIAEQAQRLLKGDDRWRPVWEDVGPLVEVETEPPPLAAVASPRRLRLRAR